MLMNALQILANMMENVWTKLITTDVCALLASLIVIVPQVRLLSYNLSLIGRRVFTEF